MEENNQQIEAEDTLIIEDENGNETTYQVDAVIEMGGKRYVLYSDGDNVSMKEIIEEENEQQLEDVPDDKMEELIKAYQEALEEDN